MKLHASRTAYFNSKKQNMESTELVLRSSIFNTFFQARPLSRSDPLPASFTHEVVPIIASSALKPRNPSPPSIRHSRAVLSSVEKGSFEPGRKFTQNADNDLRIMCEQGQLKEAVEYVELFHKGGLELDPKSYAFLLQECAKSKAYNEGRKIHALLVTSEIKMDITIRNNLLSMYVKCGNLKEARLLFEAMGTSRDVVSWTLMINACAEHDQFKEAIKLYFTMLKRDVKPNKITFVCLLKACGRHNALADGQLLHEHIIKRHLQGDKYVGGALVEMYFKCGNIKCAREAFYEITDKTPALWNLLVVSYVENERNKEALKVFQHMQRRHRVEPSEVTWAHILKACGELAKLKEGRLLHDCLCINGIDTGGYIGQELVYMYIACGCLADARHVFDQLQSRPALLWEYVIAAYSENGEYEEASKLTFQMQQTEVLSIDFLPTERTTDDEGSLEGSLDCI